MLKLLPDIKLVFTLVLNKIKLLMYFIFLCSCFIVKPQDTVATQTHISPGEVALLFQFKEGGD